MAEFNVNKEVTSKLKFQPEEKYGNLCRGYLTGVEVIENEIGKINAKGEVSTSEFAGLTIPKLIFHFEQHKNSNLDKPRYYDHKETIIPNLQSEANGGGNIEVKVLDALYGQQWDRIKHIHDCFASLSNYKALDKDVETAGKKLFAGYAASNKTAESTVKLYTAYFNAIAKAFNEGKDNKAIYTIDDKPALCWIKLISAYKTHNRLCFPTFVGTGFIELYRKDVKASISFSASESVIIGGSKPNNISVPTLGNDFSDDVKAALGL
ncbi:MAG TPA: hypothetical protein PLC53_00345 [Bacilli bacterium]|nr:hypothetical protein [Bacilli bacterium]